LQRNEISAVGFQKPRKTLSSNSRVKNQEVTSCVFIPRSNNAQKQA
jgi:hypothetical protein